ncbi:hypothetical protein [Streptomyces albogriseolus]|uniref:hypothetical protein n=1 Tax=Streptomyces albogriseolus TaxID=1887 RepID=UPI00345F525C
MSDDYAALLTTLIVAVLAVGTLQVYTLMRSYGQAQTEAVRATAEAKRRVMEALRQGQSPTPEDLRQTHVPMTAAAGFQRKNGAAVLALLVWTVTVTTLGAYQIRILRWAGSAEHPKDPHLAKMAFYVVTFAIALLLVEGLLRAFLRTFSEQWTVLAPVRQYPRSERARANRAARQFVRTGQIPAPAPSNATQPGTPANP